MVLGYSLLRAYVAEHIQLLLVFPRIPSSYQVVLWKQESFVVLCSLRIEFFRILLGEAPCRRMNKYSGVSLEIVGGASGSE